MEANMDEWRSIDYNRRLKREEELLEKSSIPDKDKKLILRYRSWRLANGVSVARTHREMVSLRLLCEKFDLRLDSINEEDNLIDVLAAIETTNWKLATKNEYKKDLKFFLKMLGQEELASKIKCREPRDNELTRDDLLTVNEVLRLVDVAMNNRDKAMIMCHLDMTCRPEELLTLTYGSFVRDNWGIKVELNRSKTFRRSPHLSFSLPYIARWLEDHPYKDDEAPVWIDFNKFREGIVAPIDNDAYRRLINRLFARANMKRRRKFTPYNFRHTGITMWSVMLTEQQISKRSGHIPGSKALRRYAKLVDADADRTILKELGLINNDESEPDIKRLQPVECGVCNEFNEPFRQRCWKCKASMDPTKLAKEFGDEEIIDAVVDEDMESMIEDKIRQMMKAILKEEGKI